MPIRLVLVSVLLSTAHAGKLWSDVCTQVDTRGLPFCDQSKSHDLRVADYVGRISLSDKQANMRNEATGIPSLHIPPYQWGSEGLHGPLQPCVCTQDNATCACPSSFPCPSALGTAFNDSLYFMIGQADGREARAINNLRNHVTQNQYGDGIDYWSPTVNMQRDPRWGRNQEVPGEDPLLTGNYAANFVQGLQGDVGGLDVKHVQIDACCKHFVANSLEQWEGHTRYDFNANVSVADLHNYYLPAFRSCVMEGRSKGVMCSYNAVTAAGVFDNVPSCANDWLLQTTLRDSWRFDGYVTSDCGAINNECQAEPQGHGYNNCTAAAAQSIKAGTDVDCGGVYPAQIVNAVKSGLLDITDVDRAFSRLTRIQMELGLFDSDKSSQPYFNLGIGDIDTAAHQQLAYEAAQQSIVLLKNDVGVLPLQPGSKIAIVGPHFNATQLLMSNYHGSRCLDGKPGAGPGTGHDFSCIVSPLEAIRTLNAGSERDAGGWVKGLPGCAVASSSVAGIAAAVSLASSADVVILAVGIDDTQEREGLDRTITTLPGVQTQLVSAVLQLNNSRTILTLFSGGAMSLGPLKDAAPAIVSANYGGEFGGKALADVLFGKHNPTGKLAATMYPPEYVTQIPLTDMGLDTPGTPGRTHMFYTGKAEFPFGAGLSYTDWTFEWAAEGAIEFTVSDAKAASSAAISVAVTLTNTGSRAGKQTLLMFWRPKTQAGGLQKAKSSHPRQKLVGYRSTNDELRPGEKTTLTFQVERTMLALVPRDAISKDAGAVLTRGEYELLVSDGSSQPALTRDMRVVA